MIPKERKIMATSKKCYRRRSTASQKKKLTAWEQIGARLGSLRDAWSRYDNGKKASIIAGLCGALAAVTVIVFLMIPRPLRFTVDENGNYLDKKNGITYCLAPLSFEPVSWKKATYATCGDSELHRISDLDPKEWLCEVNSGVGSIWYNSTLDMPDLAGFGANKIAICTETAVVMALKTMENEDHVKAVVKALQEGKGVDYLPAADRVMRLMLSSEDYPKLFYNITYLECEEGNFLYDRSTDKCVSVGTLLVWYIERGDMEPDENSLIDKEEKESGKSESESQSGPESEK